MFSHHSHNHSFLPALSSQVLGGRQVPVHFRHQGDEGRPGQSRRLELLQMDADHAPEPDAL